MSLQDKHIELVEAVNSTTTDMEHRYAELRLEGFRMCMEAAGYNLGAALIECDWHYIEQGVDRPMCCGVFLDWKAVTP